MRGSWVGSVVLFLTASCSSSGAGTDPGTGGAIATGAAGGSGGNPSGGSSGVGGASGAVGGGAVGGSAEFARDAGFRVNHGADSGRVPVDGTDGGRLSFDAGPDGKASCSGECPTRACGSGGKPCRSDELCVQQTIARSPPPPPPYAPSTSWSCAVNPCADAPVDCSCAMSLCEGQCNSAAGYDVACTYYAVCADPDTPIAAPEGERRIVDLAEGDLVFTVDHGAIVLAPIARTSRTPVRHHTVLRVVLESGSVLAISPGHPTADGRRFGDLGAGDSLDGVAIRSVRRVPYAHDATYDILPASDSGAYFAGGVLVGSTLARDATLVMTPTAPLAFVPTVSPAM